MKSNKTFLDVLEQWAKYTNYDREQTTFNLNSYDYDFHKLNKRIEDVLNNYDASGVIATIMAKNSFLRVLKNVKYSLFEMIANPGQFQQEIDMYNLFHSEFVNSAENEYANLINEMSQKVINKKLIGEHNENKFKETLFSYTDLVIDSINKCNIDVYKKGGTIKDIVKVSTHINIFPSLANCLLALENAEDGIYLCYIDVHQSADGYFGFFIKNNGNIFSINERIDEAYKGSHQNSRNGRWTESKQDNLFPYEYIFSYENYDYKGYSHKYVIDEESLSFFELTEEVYIPLLLAMILLVRKYQNKDLLEDIVYVDSLLPVNVNCLTEDKNELMAINQNEIVVSHKNVNLNFSMDDLLSGKALDEFTKEHTSYKEHVVAKNSGQIFVDLYGQGFIYDTSKSLDNNRYLLTTSADEYVPEFVGSERRLRAQCYTDIRQELAEYIREQMFIEYSNFGGIKEVKKWFEDSVRANLPHIEKILVEKYNDIQNGGKNLSVGWRSADINILNDISFVEAKYPSRCYRLFMLNEKEPYKEKVYDMRTGSVCSMFFVIKPKNYLGLEELLGKEVPKIVKGWNASGHYRSGNEILDLTDAVEEIGTPFEPHESERDCYKKDIRFHNSFYEFGIVIGYSKNGFKQLIKELKSK